jgi:DUF4097 and DUF4098 domain-containing protein YvlB
VEYALGILDLNSALGDITLHTIFASTIKLHSTSGELTVNQAAGNMEITTTQGDIAVGIPASLSFTFAARTTEGSIEAFFPYTTDENSPRNTAIAAVGENPAYSVSLSSTAGDIRVEKR